MKNVEFIHSMAHWDSWKRPCNTINNYFDVFDTGEVVVTNAHLQIDSRHHYSRVGITVCHGSELGDYIRTPMTTPEGKPVAKVHLTQNLLGLANQQLFAIDNERGEMYLVRSSYYRLGGLPNVPRDIAKRGAIYWASHEHRPVSHPIRLVSPRKLSSEQKARTEETEILCRAVVALKELPPVNKYHVQAEVYGGVSSKVHDTEVPIIDIVSNLADNTVSYIARHGVPTKQKTSTPYIKF